MNERTKKRRNERTKERRNEGTKERRNEGTKKRKNEETKEMNEETKERRNEHASSALVIGLLVLSACTDPFVTEGVRTYKDVATGGDHSCAVATDGTAWCWGRGEEGELGDGTNGISFSPQRVKGDVVFAQITAGDNHTCAITSAGRPYCWGWDAFYQLGHPADTRRNVPVAVETAVRFTSISAGAQHNCALGTDSLAYCWGLNRYGEGGDGTTLTIIWPKPVLGGIKFAQLSSGAWHTCAVTKLGELYCWGRNDTGQLGIGSTALTATAPAPAATTARFAQVDAGRSHTCAVSRSNGLYCWGSNEHGELGNGSIMKEGLAEFYVPTPISQLYRTGEMISAGASFTCAAGASITINSSMRCWGRGESGQLGNGATIDHRQPQPVYLPGTPLLKPTQLALGGYTHACALIEEAVFCWGTGRAGQLGNAQGTVALLPQRIDD